MGNAFAQYCTEVAQVLSDVLVTTGDGRLLDPEEGLASWHRHTADVRDEGRSVFFIGNGASAAMASHMAADLCKNANIRGMAFNDIAMVTAVSNDVSYENVFAIPLQRHAQPGDMVVAISSSGSSPNIVKAVRCARDADLFVTTLTGMERQNTVRALGHLNFYVPGRTYGLTECCHQVLLHCWLDNMLNGHHKPKQAARIPRRSEARPSPAQ